MAYEIMFWADHRDPRPDPGDVALALAGGGAVEGLAPFDARATVAALAADFPGLVVPEGESGGTDWVSPDQQVSFEFSWSPQHLHVTARGQYTKDQLNAVVDAGIDVGGGRLYDLQTRERFDGF